MIGFFREKYGIIHEYEKNISSYMHYNHTIRASKHQESLISIFEMHHKVFSQGLYILKCVLDQLKNKLCININVFDHMLKSIHKFAYHIHFGTCIHISSPFNGKPKVECSRDCTYQHLLCASSAQYSCDLLCSILFSNTITLLMKASLTT